MTSNVHLDHLKAQRRDIAAKLAATMEAQAKVREATSAESAAISAIGDLGRREVEAVQRWASTGGTEAMPEPDLVERRRLGEALVAAQAKAQAALGALATFDVAQRDLSAELQSINQAINNAAFDALAECHAAEVANLAAFVREHVAPKIARAFGLHAWLAELGQRHIASGRTDSGTAYLRRAEAIGLAMPGLDAEPTPGEVIDKMALWSSRFAELTSDSPAGNVIAIGGAAA